MRYVSKKCFFRYALPLNALVDHPAPPSQRSGAHSRQAECR
jgi:hypothetical protein